MAARLHARNECATERAPRKVTKAAPLCRLPGATTVRARVLAIANPRANHMNTSRLVGRAVAVLSLWLFNAAAPAQAQEPFSIVLLPDPQNYSEFSSYGVYSHQTQWIANNRAARNIRFVVHLGDITNHDTTTEYDVANA